MLFGSAKRALWQCHAHSMKSRFYWTETKWNIHPEFFFESMQGSPMTIVGAIGTRPKQNKRAILIDRLLAVGLGTQAEADDEQC